MYAPRPAAGQVLAPSVQDYFRGLSTLRRVSVLCAGAGMLLTWLAAVCNWYTVTTTSSYRTSRWTQEQPVSIGTLLLGDTEEQYTNPYAGSSHNVGKRPEFSSYADVYAILYLLLTFSLVLLVVAALMVQGKWQLWLRIGAAGCAALSLFLVILISADLSAMANAYQDFMTEQGKVSDGEGITYTVEKNVGVGLLLAAMASLLLGVSSGLNHVPGEVPVAARGFAPQVLPAGAPRQPYAAPAGYRPPGPG
ncbi:MAG: hypothetical protein ACRDT4_21390, partial [Micromonosporaceae bacterium]